MAEQTTIAWCTSTFNPWKICTPVGPGCDHCYAAALSKRYGWGEYKHGVPRQRTSTAYWKQPLTWNKKATGTGKPWRVFCASLADVFDNEAPDEWRRDLWDLIELTPNLTWLLLTKRIGNAIRMLRTNDWAASSRWNVWLGASVVNQEEADRDIPKLLATPARKHFVSYEPALGPVDWSRFPGLDWIIVGGESTQGAKAREFPVHFARSTIRQARKIGAATLIKQMGSFVTDRNDAGFDGWDPEAWPLRPDGCDPVIDFEPFGYEERAQGAACRIKLVDRAGANPAEWPEDLRVQEFPK